MTFFHGLCVASYFVFSILTFAYAADGGSTTFRDLSIPDRSGEVMTVLGPMDADDIGHTTMHEHMFIDYWLPLNEPERWERLGVPRPTSDDELKIWRTKLTTENRPVMLNHLLRMQEPFQLNEIGDAVTSAEQFKSLGGATIVDVTTIGLNRQPAKLVKVAKKSGVNIVMGAGFYRWPWHPETMPDLSIDDLTYEIVSDIVNGADGTGVRAGIIGEIPAEHMVLDPKESDEVRVLRAVARASRLTGAAITLHSPVDFKGNLYKVGIALDVLEAEGADLSRVVVGHVSDFMSADKEFMQGLLDRGVYLQFDILGMAWPGYFNQKMMLDAILNLIEAGHADRLLVGHDRFSKFNLLEYGGFDLTFVHAQMVPYLKNNGVSDADIEKILAKNPAKVLSFVAPRALETKALR